MVETSLKYRDMLYPLLRREVGDLLLYYSRLSSVFNRFTLPYVGVSQYRIPYGFAIREVGNSRMNGPLLIADTELFHLHQRSWQRLGREVIMMSNVAYTQSGWRILSSLYDTIPCPTIVRFHRY